MASNSNKAALVSGATGGAGRFVAAALLDRGWAVRALHRDPNRARTIVDDDRIDWCAGDALSESDVTAAAEGTTLIFHGVNPPNYRNWRGIAPPMLANAIAAAGASGARLIFPGNIYNYGPDAGAVLREESPQNPTTRKGRVRVEMEQMLERAAVERGTRSLILRAGDFLADVPGSWLRAVMVKPNKPLRSIVYPGKREVGHAWAYLPDLAETVARLAEMESSLPDFDSFHFGGHWIEPGVAIAEAAKRVAGNPGAPIRGFPWPAVYLAAPFVGFMRELIEMRYLWMRPIRLDNSKLVTTLGEEPHTPIDGALEEVLLSMRVIG